MIKTKFTAKSFEYKLTKIENITLVFSISVVFFFSHLLVPTIKRNNIFAFFFFDVINKNKCQLDKYR